MKKTFRVAPVLQYIYSQWASNYIARPEDLFGVEDLVWLDFVGLSNLLAIRKIMLK